MDKEERAKYDCVKDKENLDKAIKSGRGFLYLSQYQIKVIYSSISILAIYGLLICAVLAGTSLSSNDQMIKQNQLLVKQVDQYIKNDFNKMSCIEKANYIIKYSNDENIVIDPIMNNWLQSTYQMNCSSK